MPHLFIDCEIEVYCDRVVHQIDRDNSTLGMDPLTVYGLVAVLLMLVFYAVEDRSPWFILAFAGSCLMASSYGFLQGAWPFGAVEAVWSLIALRRWHLRRHPNLLRSTTIRDTMGDEE
jgi:hypothetical protein